eukprot:CAMPEP_0114154174 /NCGR_PEP_ID=MMETSP0043_2-20121206/24760_1 /TAXON_ID=464988 /ORGANISM="Hemiselmis andersenii, Strain CCMP644" /LENGTH=44 /DNA_ID= /DNA_START= /DNA_END= /DNA_ORIENTATION=
MCLESASEALAPLWCLMCISASSTLVLRAWSLPWISLLRFAFSP